MRLKNVLIVVEDMDKSIKFYQSLFGLDVILNQEANVILTEGLVLQLKDVWEEALGKDIVFGNNCTELYFEERNMDQFMKKLKEYPEPIEIVTSLTTFSWNQQMIRLYDPDGNLIEVRTGV